MTERVFDVVVPAGSRLRTRTVCQGRTSVTVHTRPPSDAESELACREDAPHEVIVEEQHPHPGPAPLRVVVSAPAPARWYAVLSAVQGPAGAPRLGRCSSSASTPAARPWVWPVSS